MVITAAVDPNHNREQLVFRALRCIDIQIQAIFTDFRIISFIKIELVPPELANGVQVFRLHCLVAPFVANAHAVPRLREILRGFPTQFPYRGLCKRDTFINGDALCIRGDALDVAVLMAATADRDDAGFYGFRCTARRSCKCAGACAEQHRECENQRQNGSMDLFHSAFLSFSKNVNC